MRVVLDTDVLVAGFRSDRGASRQLPLLALDRQITILVSVPLMLEYEAVLTRPEHLEQSRLTIKEVGSVLDALASSGEPVPLRFLWRPQLKDPNDEIVLETAINGFADYLVTFNLRHFEAAAIRFGFHASQPGQTLRKFIGKP